MSDKHSLKCRHATCIIQSNCILAENKKKILVWLPPVGLQSVGQDLTWACWSMTWDLRTITWLKLVICKTRACPRLCLKQMSSIEELHPPELEWLELKDQRKCSNGPLSNWNCSSQLGKFLPPLPSTNHFYWEKRGIVYEFLFITENKLLFFVAFVWDITDRHMWF